MLSYDQGRMPATVDAWQSLIHPDDLPCVEAIRDTLLPLFEGPVVLKLEGDAGVGRGGCRVETPTRFIDATIDAQMARLEAALKREP